MNLLIVDDEISVRKHLQLMLEGSGLEVREAENGQAALDVLENNVIDLMLTDIRMPFMDGIALIQQCKLRYPKLWTIVLSNFAEFDLAQMAIRYGAKNYLLKATISKESLIAEINHCCEEMAAESLKIQQSKLDYNEMLMVQNSLFFEWRLQHINSVELIKRSSKFNVQVFQFEETKSMLALLEVDGFAEWCQVKFHNKTDLAIYAFQNVASEVIKRFHPRNELFHLETARFIVLDFDENDCELHHEKMKNVQLALKQYLQLEICLIFGYEFATLNSLLEAIRKTAGDAKHLFYSPTPCLLDRHDCDYAVKDMDLYSFFQSIEMDNPRTSVSNLPAWIGSFFDLLIYLRRPPGIVKEDLKFLIAFIEKKGYSVTEQLKTKIQNMEAIRLTEYKNAFDQWVSGYHYWDTQRIEVVKALNYIHLQYKNKITLDDICRHINMSRSHFSKLFKDQMGITVMEYVEEFRMKQAKLLIRTTPLTIGEISTQVGVPDLFYFSKLYKRFYKINPSKDRG
ncbi:response regulator transcription factor [Paenibacillus alba]|uniref:Response regulator n=1 Tax=Paenibacillus alba TaxID=1197127 RepID=A0ABU6GBG5_9BACL|nr:response regulator [Paenibacillus alba]MEC0230064.1 response regulator [Paenibacillus alba]